MTKVPECFLKKPHAWTHGAKAFCHALATPVVLVPKKTKPALPPLRGLEMFESASTAKRTANVLRTRSLLLSSSMRYERCSSSAATLDQTAVVGSLIGFVL